MSVSTKELFTAFFKGLAFAKGLNFGEKNRGMAEDTKEDGFATLTDKNGNTYVAQMNESEKERYKETGKKLSQVKKEEKAKKEQEQKETEEKTRKEAEAKKKAEEEAKKKETEQPKKNFKDRIKDIAYQDFKMTNTDWWYEPKYVEQQLNKLDPEDPVTEKALKSVEEAIKTGDTRLIKSRIDGISHYANDKEKYLRSFKATKDSFKSTVKLYDNILEKLKKVDTAPIREELKTKAKALWDKHGLDIQDVDKALNNLEKKDGLGRFSKQLKLSDKYYEVLGQIEASKNQLEIVLKRTEKFNPAKDPLYDLKLRKDYVTKTKSAAKDYFNQHNLAMDSADFAEIQSLLNELDNGNNGLDLFINNVNIER